MSRRDRLISASILKAIFNTDPQDEGATRRGFFARIWAFFSFFSLVLERYRAQLFKALRNHTWDIEEDEYTESFRNPGKSTRLVAVGDLGYSGSVRLTTEAPLHDSTDSYRLSSPRQIQNT